MMDKNPMVIIIPKLLRPPLCGIVTVFSKGCLEKGKKACGPVVKHSCDVDISFDVLRVVGNEVGADNAAERMCAQDNFLDMKRLYQFDDEL
jgi:hypothetical protein